MRDAVQDLVKLGRHHDMSDALIKEISDDAGDAAGRYAQHEVKGQIKDHGEQLVEQGARLGRRAGQGAPEPPREHFLGRCAMRRFEVYCPAGWTHVDLSQDVGRTARSLALVTVPDAAIEGRGALVSRVTHQLETAFAAMAEGGVWSVMMPVTGPAAIAVRPTVVFAPLSLPPGRQPMDAVVALAASDPTAEVIDIDPLVGAPDQSHR